MLRCARLVAIPVAMLLCLPPAVDACDPKRPIPPQVDIGAATPKHDEVLGKEICVGGNAGQYRCDEIDMMSAVPLETLGGARGNDIWGWTDTRDGREYAIMGLDTGTAFVDVSEPEHPEIVGFLPTQTVSSSWRDIKVYKNHAFVVSEASNHGMQVFNLRQLRANLGQPTRTYSAGARYNAFGNAHNIAINEETGFAYAVGTTTCGNGGLHMIDIRTPGQPRMAGCFSDDGYTHDVQCVVYRGPDAEHFGREVCFASNEDTVTIVDVTDKSAPRMLSRSTYSESQYTHQGWLSEDHTLFFQNDELDEQRLSKNTRTNIWDVSDLDAPTLRRRYTHDNDAVDHNNYVVGNHVFQANYTSGLRVLRIANFNTGRVEMAGYFDLYPQDDPGNGAPKHPDHADGDIKGDGEASFNGAWSVYPYFQSGTVIVSSINHGLFILRPRFAFSSGGSGGGGGGGGGGSCDEPVGGGRYCTECGPCAEGQGDCDNNAECASGLTCVDNIGAQFGFAPGIDVCVASGGGGGGGGGCALPNGHPQLCSQCGPCGNGEGDCDNDAECAPGLVCADNVGAQFGFPGGIDVCVPADGSSCGEPLGAGRYCTECGPCAEGQGDCDNDAECAAGLTCVDNIGAQFGFAPGVDVCVSQ